MPLPEISSTMWTFSLDVDNMTSPGIGAGFIFIIINNNHSKDMRKFSPTDRHRSNERGRIYVKNYQPSYITATDAMITCYVKPKSEIRLDIPGKFAKVNVNASPVPTPAPQAAVKPQSQPTVQTTTQPKPNGKRWKVIVGIGTGIAAIGTGIFLALRKKSA